MMRIRSLYMHISRSSINASRTGRVCAMRCFFFFVRGGGEVKNSNVSTLYQKREKTQTELDV